MDILGSRAVDEGRVADVAGSSEVQVESELLTRVVGRSREEIVVIGKSLRPVGGAIGRNDEGQRWKCAEHCVLGI